jgi:hypothetical protein
MHLRLKARLLCAAALLCAGTLLAPAASSAPTKQEVQQADKLFREARTLMGQNKFDAACPKLEQSQKLDPAPGTQYQLAVCYEATGRPATALALFTEVADLAQKAGFKDKEKVARDKASALEPKVPRIIVEVPASSRVSGLSISRDGKEVPDSQYNQPILVDPGEYAIAANAPNKKPFDTTVSVRGEGVRVKVPIVLVDVESFSRRDDIPPPPPPPPPKKSSFGVQRIAGLGMAAVGVGGVAVGAVFGVNAKSTYDKAINNHSLCPTKKACYPDGKKLVDEAQTDALISTIGFIAGGVVLAGGVLMFSLAPSRSASPPNQTGAAVGLVPVVAQGFGGVAAVGQF